MTRSVAYYLFVLLLLFGLSGPSRADGGAPACDIENGQVTLDGATLHYRKAGTGPSILLLHGLFAQKEQWDGVLCLLAVAGHTAIAPDLPGYGQSSGFPLSDYKLENQVGRLHQFMNNLGVARFDLAGSSMGGAIAAFYAGKYPAQVRSLAFIGAPLGVDGWSPQVREAIYQGINPFIPVDLPQFDLEMSLLFAHPPAIPEAVKTGLVKEYVDHNQHYQQVWNIVNLYGMALSGRGVSRIPTLILWGTDDKVFAIEDADRLHRRFPRGRLVRLAHAGHLPLLENPGETADIYLRFLKSFHGK